MKNHDKKNMQQICFGSNFAGHCQRLNGHAILGESALASAEATGWRRWTVNFWSMAWDIDGQNVAPDQGSIDIL